MRPTDSCARKWHRRDIIKLLGASAIAGPLLTGCRGSSSNTSTTIKIGFVSPITGPAAGFGEPDSYVLGLARKAFANGLTIGGKKYDVQIIDKDGQSNAQRGAQVANDLINGDGIDLMLTTSTPETVNPVSDACEAAGVPCISTVVPWEAWYYGRGAKPGQEDAYKYVYHFCFGVEQFHLAYTHLWPQIPTNQKVGVMWPNDSDGNDLANRRADSLGLLHRKRLELARAIATNPRVLLLDEIGGGLTDAEAVELVSMIKQLHHLGISVVWIEHVVHVLVQAVDRLVCMNAGRVIADGVPEAVLRDALVVDAYLGKARK